MLRKVYLNASALQHNLKVVRCFAPQSKVLAMVKCNAYGHSLLFVAKALAQAKVDGFGVATLDEALKLRYAGITQTIVLMNGCQNLPDLQLAQQHELSIIVHQVSQLELLKTLDVAKPLSVWIKIDSGMHRLGIAPEKLPMLWHALNQLKVIQKPIGLLTHFADSFAVAQAITKQQIQVFNEVCAQLPAEADYFTSLSNSAAIVGWPGVRDEAWVRPGIMLYGSSPFLDKKADELNLQPVMTVKSQIIAVNHFAAGAAIGYSGIFVCQRPSRIAVIAFGYGDGYPRHVYNNAVVLIKNHRVPVVGRVSMDMITVDITDFEDIQQGDEVTLWGEGLSIDELAVAANTISYEIFCRMPTHRMDICLVEY